MSNTSGGTLARETWRPSQTGLAQSVILKIDGDGDVTVDKLDEEGDSCIIIKDNLSHFEVMQVLHVAAQ